MCFLRLCHFVQQAAAEVFSGGCKGREPVECATQMRRRTGQFEDFSESVS